ncbi:MAG: hypothetical protein LQ341_002143 [Variospora aurantia]|nr:MAG: hypothetical protein LQ341_002143 [Variospora aurantia]
MSGVVIKIGSLLLKTLSKPVANYIKGQAREHPRFRRLCIAGAQRIHRLDMSLRLGLLQDRAAIDKQIDREAAEALAKRQKREIPTVKTESQAKAEESKSTADKAKGEEKTKISSKPKIRPLSEAKAIDAGANFASESFLLSVGIGLIVFERWWANRRETSRREDVADRINELEESENSTRRVLLELEKEILRLRAKAGEKASSKRILPREFWKVEDQQEEGSKASSTGLFSWFRGKPQVKNPATLQQEQPRMRPDEEAAEAQKTMSSEKAAKTISNFWPFAESAQSYRSEQQLFLVLTPVSILGSQRHTLMSRIERFAILTTNPKPAVAFLLANNSTQSSSINGFHAYTTLHELSVSLALLPVASPSQLVLLLKKYVDSSLPGHCTSATSPPMRLLRQITATGPYRPLPEHSSNVLSDICGSIKDVAAIMENEQEMKVLEDYVGEEDARNIERFWAEDLICE